MRNISMEMLIKKLSQLYVAKYLERQVLNERLNKLALSQLQNHSVSAELVSLNNRLTESLLMLEQLTNIFEQLGACDAI